MTDDDPHRRREMQLPAAQTTVQLFEQLLGHGFSDRDLRRVRAACAEALTLFAGRMHSSGKPYLAHCIGAASTLAGLGAGTDLVVAGLMHGAYRWGDFGAWCVTRPLKRQRLRRRLDARVERYAYGFDTLPWNLQAITTLSDRLEALDPVSRDVVLMRLVSELDNLSGRSILYRPDADRRRDALRARGPILVELARRLGFPALSRALADAVAETLDGAVAPELRSSIETGALLAPASSRVRPQALLTRWLAAPFRRLRSRRRG